MCKEAGGDHSTAKGITHFPMQCNHTFSIMKYQKLPGCCVCSRILALCSVKWNILRLSSKDQLPKWLSMSIAEKLERYWIQALAWFPQRSTVVTCCVSCVLVVTYMPFVIACRVTRDACMSIVKYVFPPYSLSQDGEVQIHDFAQLCHRTQ